MRSETLDPAEYLLSELRDANVPKGFLESVRADDWSVLAPLTDWLTEHDLGLEGLISKAIFSAMFKGGTPFELNPTVFHGKGVVVPRVAHGRIPLVITVVPNEVLGVAHVTSTKVTKRLFGLGDQAVCDRNRHSGHYYDSGAIDKIGTKTVLLTSDAFNAIGGNVRPGMSWRPSLERFALLNWWYTSEECYQRNQSQSLTRGRL